MSDSARSPDVESQNTVAHDPTVCAVAENIRNGSEIEWLYWRARRAISPEEGARLAYCFDPIRWPADEWAQGPIPTVKRVAVKQLAAWLKERNAQWTLHTLAEALGPDMAPFAMKLAVQESATRDDSRDPLGWWNVTLGASFWWRRESVSPREAAMLLCRLNPLKEDEAEPESTTTDETTPHDFLVLLRLFEDAAATKPKHRRLRDWLAIAREEPAKYHSWVDEWVAAHDHEAGVDESPPVETQHVIRNTLSSRRDVLDQPIDTAIAAVGEDSAAVFVELREKALNEDPPFAGVEGNALLYTDVNNKKRKLTAEALKKRMQRRSQR